jgi:ribose transport system permease protein
MGFSLFAPAFFSFDNLKDILVQSSWLITVALGVNFALLSAGVDLSVGSTMYLAAVVVSLSLTHAGPLTALVAAILTGAAFGAVNGFLVVRFTLLGFVVTLATLFIGRGLALLASSTRIVYAPPLVADFGRATLAGVPWPLVLALLGVALAWVILNRTPFGPYVRSLGANAEGARRAGVRTKLVTFAVYALSGAFAGFGGFISLCQTSAASAAFGDNAEFLAVAAAVLGGTSLFGGRGHLRAPVVGAIVITMVQNGLVLMNVNPYTYPVATAAVIFVAAAFDSLRLKLQTQAARVDT